MCIIIYTESGAKIPETVLRDQWDANSDGAGIMYSDGKNIYHTKGLMSYNDFMVAYHSALKITNKIAIHFRKKSHGVVSEDNTHPFLVNKNIGLMHNGTISRCSPEKKDHRSDTAIFADKLSSLLEELNDSALFSEKFLDFIQPFVGLSRILFMNNLGNVSIINRDLWSEKNGILYSAKPYDSTEKQTENKKTDNTVSGLENVHSFSGIALSDGGRTKHVGIGFMNVIAGGYKVSKCIVCGEECISRVELRANKNIGLCYSCLCLVDKIDIL